MSENDYRKGDVIRIVDDWCIREDMALPHNVEMYKSYIGQTGMILLIYDEDYVKAKYKIKFIDGKILEYMLEDLKKATEEEHDRFYLMRFIDA